jgi:hypothetical protein
MAIFKSISSFLEEKYKKIQDKAREALNTVLKQAPVLASGAVQTVQVVQSIISQNILSAGSNLAAATQQIGNWASSLNQAASSIINNSTTSQLLDSFSSAITQQFGTQRPRAGANDTGGTGDPNISGISGSSNPISDVINAARLVIGQSGPLGQTLLGISDTIAGMFVYKDGVTETRYGVRMEETWSKSATSFLETFKNPNDPRRQYRVNFLDSTPLDSDNDASSIYGNMVLGTPPIFTEITDPNNRVMINTFLKDSTFVSLTPGLPKYNGGSINQLINSLGTDSRTFDQLVQNGDEMMAYLTKNGIDAAFAENDKRYYTFESKYSEYYSYLETMLNTIWIKLGLGKEEEGKFNLFSFFNVKTKDGLEPEAYSTNNLKEQYKSSIGFFVNPAGAVSESVNSSPFNSNLESDTNAASDTYQQLNFITGMGTSNIGSIRRNIGVTMRSADIFRENVAGKIKVEGKGLARIASLVGNLAEFSNTQDLGAVVQQFSTTNGMKVVYPMLWNTSDYSKNINFTFNFVSPYGDPLSIFQYVYVPFFALLTFALPRQAAENGFVSPFFVRADIPGVVTSDLALITDLTWTKGGSDGTMWTKDRLPRAISGSFNVTDLYPYLSMVKRLSFMSANPSFTVFLDNLAGFGSLYNNDDRDPINIYWREMLNRVAGTKTNITSDIWNTASESSRRANSIYNATYRESLSRSIKSKAVPWFTKR